MKLFPESRAVHFNALRREFEVGKQQAVQKAWHLKRVNIG
jgi:hypothetical protein